MTSLLDGTEWKSKDAGGVARERGQGLLSTTHGASQYIFLRQR